MALARVRVRLRLHPPGCVLRYGQHAWQGLLDNDGKMPDATRNPGVGVTPPIQVTGAVACQARVGHVLFAHGVQQRLQQVCSALKSSRRFALHVQLYRSCQRSYALCWMGNPGTHHSVAVRTSLCHSTLALPPVHFAY